MSRSVSTVRSDFDAPMKSYLITPGHRRFYLRVITTLLNLGQGKDTTPLTDCVWYRDQLTPVAPWTVRLLGSSNGTSSPVRWELSSSGATM